MNRYYDPEFKRNAVELILSSGKPVKQIARELGCSASALGAWKRSYENDNSALAQDSTQMNIDELYKHNQALQKELVRVTQEREILKKAAAILGR